MTTQSRVIKSITFFAALSFLLALPVGTIIFLTKDFYRQHQTTTTHIPTKSLELKPLLSIIDGILHQDDSRHHYKLQVHAEQADIMRNSSRIICTNMNATIFDKDHHKIQITAGQGIIAQDEKLLYFPTNAQATSDDTTFNGNQITYHIDKREISTTQPFVLKNNNVYLQATGGRVDIKTWQAHLYGNVQTTIISHDMQQLQ